MNKLHLLSAVALSVLTANAADEPNIFEVGERLANPPQRVVERNLELAAIEEHREDAAPLLREEEEEEEEEAQPARQPRINFEVPAVRELLGEQPNRGDRLEEIDEDEEDENADDHDQDEFDELGGPDQDEEQAILREQELQHQRQRQLLAEAAEERRIIEQEQELQQEARERLERALPQIEEDLAVLGYRLPALQQIVQQGAVNPIMRQAFPEGIQEVPEQVGEIVKDDKGVRYRWNGSKFVRL